MILDVVLLLGGIQIDQSIGIAFLQQFAEEHQFNIIVIERITSICVERILSIPVSLSYTETMNSGSTSILPVSLLQDLFRTLTIWNTLILYWFQLVSLVSLITYII